LRRHALVGLALAGTVAALAGCGFELRRPVALPFAALQLSGFAARSPLADELRDAVNATTTTRVASQGAPVVLESLADVRERSVVASTAAGQVREVQLRARFEFRLRTASGRELLPAAQIALARDMSYSETIALAKAEEEALLYRAMQRDIVAQVMRRLAAAPAP
jgi:LPS-assembly lipoprotein